MVGQRGPASNLARTPHVRAPAHARTGAGGFSRARLSGPSRRSAIMAAPVTALSVQLRSGSPPRVRSAAACLLLLAGCYSGDFFGRLVDPTATAAFRITRLTLIDPHAFTGNDLSCSDYTAKLNASIAESIRTFDLNTTLVLHPLDPAIDDGAQMEILPAKCVPGGELVNCTDKDVPLASIVSADFNNSVGGTCGNPVAGSLNPIYMTDSNEALHQATSPCFVSAPIPALSLQLSPTSALPLSNVQIYASYSLDDKPQELVSGVLFGFVSKSVSMMTFGDVGGTPLTPWSILRDGGGCEPTGMNVVDIDTLDPEDGVWMYFNFTAQRAAWFAEGEQPGATSGTGDATSADVTTTTGPTTGATDLTTGVTTGATDLTTGSTTVVTTGV